METLNEAGLRQSTRKLADTRAQRLFDYRILSMLVLLGSVFLLSFTLGRYAISIPDILHLFYAKLFGLNSSLPDTVETVVFTIRIPRIIAAMLVGAALSMSGACYQGLFKNPMVSPDILGASAGAGFGAAVGILLSLGMGGVQISAFFFGLAAVALTFAISCAISKGGHAVLVLVLTGMVVAAMFTSFISIAKYLADPYSKLPEITFWLMGGLSSVGIKELRMIVGPLLLGAVPLLLLRWKLNVMSFGEEEAKAMGIETAKLRTVIIICSTLLTAASVSVCGMVGWVGLVIPHLARMLVGANYQVLLPASLLTGSTFLLLVDDIARSAFPVEVPLGILTSLLGAPFFIYLLLKGKRGWV